MPPLETSVGSLGLLVVALVVGFVAIVMIRARWRRQGDDHGDWEKTLVDYRNLRDEGVLSDEEFRKIRTLVEPRTRIGTPDLRGRQRPATDPRGRTIRGRE